LSATQDFVGRGICFPFAIDHTGGLAWAGGGDALDRSLRMILSTAPSERVMRPDFGCAIWDLLFAPLDANTLGLMADAVRQAIARWEPRVELEDVVVEPDPGRDGMVAIHVTYRTRDTNDRRNLVYPFYVIPHEGEEDDRP
jgi:phage baseplate assembly protein W